MARIDAQLLLSENQAVTGANANSNVIDLGLYCGTILFSNQIW